MPKNLLDYRDDLRKNGTADPRVGGKGLSQGEQGMLFLELIDYTQTRKISTDLENELYLFVLFALLYYYLPILVVI